jgi:alkanesulfonate monooxygenase SsuD/methylene tetrahydromethanopterin reductase-like flavin-dependent oxidoreductase (luciferase family)
MRFALQAGGATYDEFLGWARFAESRGLDALGIPDHYLRGRDEGAVLDAITTMAGLARDTESIELVMLVSPVTWRHPGVLAKQAATISEMSGGRFTLGVGTGWLEREHDLFGFDFHDRATRFEMLEEALAYLRAAFADPPQAFAGKHYRFEAFDMQPRPPLRLVVGGTGTHKTPTLAGKYCDELNAYPAPPDVFEAKVARARRAAADNGRDPGELLISSSGFFVAGDTEDEYRAELEARAETLGASVEELEESMKVRNSPHGTWDRVRATLAGMEAAGMQRFFIQVVGASAGDEGFAEIEHTLEKLT